MKSPISLSDVCLLRNGSTAHSKGAAATAGIGSLDHNFHLQKCTYLLTSLDGKTNMTLSQHYKDLRLLQIHGKNTFISVLLKVHIELRNLRNKQVKCCTCFSLQGQIQMHKSVHYLQYTTIVYQISSHIAVQFLQFP